MTEPMTDRPIAVLGGGLIGASWAALFRHHGADVTVWDPDPEARSQVEARMAQPLEHLRQLHGAPGRLGKALVTGDLSEAMTGAVLVQENAPDDAAVKRDLFAQVEAAADPDAVFASSTSSLTWSELSPGLREPSRLITAHPFNPPHLIPLVELFGVDDELVARAEALYAATRRTTIRLRRDAAGHVANRLASALWREAVHIVAEGIADVEAVDAALVNGPGLRWSVAGSHMAYHLGGGLGGLAGYLAHLGPGQMRRWNDLGAPSLTPEVTAALVAGVEAEADGRGVQELEAARDAALIAMLRARRTAGPIEGPRTAS
ncbi:MAG: 3-hydroxyacyl-CoA dehydrogenase NAD-binding domain-containing protein [Pseudomonadota bacterium]